MKNISKILLVIFALIYFSNKGVINTSKGKEELKNITGKVWEIVQLGAGTIKKEVATATKK